MAWNFKRFNKVQMDKRLDLQRFFIFFLIFNCLCFGQSRMGRDNDLRKSNIEQFHLKVVPQASSTDHKILLRSHVLIPSYALQFVKDNGNFESNFEARLSLLDEDGQQLENKTINQTLHADDYLETIEKSNWYIIEHDFIVDPGKYTVVCEVMDTDTRNRGVHEKKLDLKKYAGDFILFPPQGMIAYRGFWQGGEKLMPSYQNSINVHQSTLPILISGHVRNSDYQIRVVLKNKDGNTLASLDSTFKSQVEFFTHQLHLPLDEIHGLRVKLEVSIEQNGASVQEEVELRIKRPGISANIRDIDEAIDQMRYILTNEERSELSKVKKKDKDQLFYTFWQSRDPTPGTSANELMEQYYSRVRYAIEHFTSFTPGWRTDMGMIYILFGAPDDIERIFMNSNRNAHQTWQYYRINRSFTFYDENGFGDYRLTTPYIYGRAW